MLYGIGHKTLFPTNRNTFKSQNSFAYHEFVCIGVRLHEKSNLHGVGHSPQKKSPLKNLKNLLLGNGWRGTLTKDSISKLGLNVLLAYGFVSNISYVTCVILSWVSHGRLYGKSPLAAGQWKTFLLIYSGFFAANNVLRPLRFSLSLVLTPFFDKLILRLRQYFGLSRTAATGLLVFLVNVIGTLSYLIVGLTIATKRAGVPLLP